MYIYGSERNQMRYSEGRKRNRNNIDLFA